MSTINSSVQRRARAQLSCTPCRTGKLKCDRGHPCDQCVKRTKDSDCSYQPAPKRKPRRPASTKDRISQLEELVVKLMNQEPGTPRQAVNAGIEPRQELTPESQPTGSSPEQGDDSESEASETGQIRISNGEANYVGGAHWEAILARIEELKTTVGTEADETRRANDRCEATKAHSRLVLMGRSTVTREYLLQSQPSVEAAERLLHLFFNSSNPLLPLIHRPTFLVEYDNLVNDPSNTTVVWIALFYGMLSLGCQVSLFQSPPDEQYNAILKDAARYQMLSNEALVLADVTKPQKYLIEAMMMYAGSEHMRGDEADGLRIWLTVGAVLRLCLRMGYHRDPSLIKTLSPFDREIRRRVWYTVYIFDVLLSFSIGLPDMIRQIQSDCRPPRNITDTDFGPNNQELPISRPFTELTPVAYCIVKARLVKLFALAADISHSLAHPDPEEVLKIDTSLEEAYGSIPDSLKFVSMRHCIVDPPAVIFNRFKLQLLYQKTRCVLYRRYLAGKTCRPEEEPFRENCAEAAMQILKHWEILHSASQQGGQLATIPFFLDSFSITDFLLAAMIVCLELDRLRKSPGMPSSKTQQKMTAIKSLLETTYRIYAEPAQCRNKPVPEKAVRALETILNKARRADPPRNVESRPTTGIPQQTLPYFSPPAAPGNTSATYMSQTTSSTPYSSLQSWQEPFGDTYMSSECINWQQWDAALRSTTVDQSGAPCDWDAMDIGLDLTGGIDGFQSFNGTTGVVDFTTTGQRLNKFNEF